MAKSRGRQKSGILRIQHLGARHEVNSMVSTTLHPTRLRIGNSYRSQPFGWPVESHRIACHASHTKASQSASLSITFKSHTVPSLPSQQHQSVPAGTCNSNSGTDLLRSLPVSSPRVIKRANKSSNTHKKSLAQKPHKPCICKCIESLSRVSPFRLSSGEENGAA